ncbi:hypothetical protein WA026_020344 [Henosepilachna vigintioctopunctata]|uniref:Uncharacterized protein n=1 Tax=Henosepilachna vigintioctopunctata TaxID=420089 RepID=A0AAW1U0V6_9CUCU
MPTKDETYDKVGKPHGLTENLQPATMQEIHKSDKSRKTTPDLVNLNQVNANKSHSSNEIQIRETVRGYFKNNTSQSHGRIHNNAGSNDGDWCSTQRSLKLETNLWSIGHIYWPLNHQ